MYQVELSETALALRDDPNVTPKGYKLLIALAKFMDKSRGGVIIPGQSQADEQTACIIGAVLKMGDGAYSGFDRNGHPRVPSGPWCSEGDVVIFRAYSGTRFKVNDEEFRLINDDTVEAVVNDPSQIERA